MKRLFTACMAIVFMSGCSNSANTSQSSDSTATTKNTMQPGSDSSKMTDSSKMVSSAGDIDSKFANEAALAGKMEIELGKVAGQNASSKSVKNFGAMMVKDHTKAGEELKQIALAKHMSLPSDFPKEDQDKMDQLKSKKGHDFDKAYMDEMVSGHTKVANLFDDESKKGVDSALRNFAAKTLPTIQAHLDEAKKCADMTKM